MYANMVRFGTYIADGDAISCFQPRLPPTDCRLTANEARARTKLPLSRRRLTALIYAATSAAMADTFGPAAPDST